MKPDKRRALEQIKKLGDISKINYGYTEKTRLEEIGPKFLRITDIQDGNVDWNSVPYCQISNDELPKYLLRNDDIVFARTGATTGKSFLVKNPPLSVFASYLIRLRILDFKVLMPKFLYLFFQTKTYWDKIQIGVSGSAQGGFNASKLSELKINLPSIEEQKRIVGILDEVFEGVAKAKENVEGNLRNVSEVFEAYLQSVFTNRSGWLEKRLDQVGDTQTGSTPKTSEKENFGNFIPFIKPADFNKDGSLNYENDGLSEIGLKKSRLIEKGSVMMVCIGATIGKCGFCDRDVTANQQINSLKPTKNILHKLIYYQMLTENFQSRVIFGSGQATLPIINKSKWSALKVVFPADIEEQKSIVTKLDALSTETKKLEAIYKTKLNHLEELKKSILKKAFNGEL